MSAKSPSAARNPRKGSAAPAYEAPVRTSGTPRLTAAAGMARMANASEIKPGAGTGADSVKVRRIKE